MQKYIFVTGGVISGLGKGIAAASIGMLLKNRGYSIAVLKFDPYLNVDPGTMNPCQHGEVFVTEDGGETDLDLGHYERFIDINTYKDSSCSSGQIYSTIINKERTGDFLGKTVQIIPHVTDEIKRRVYNIADKSKADIIIVEIGGTIGDIESEPFIEAVRQLKNQFGRENAINVHLSYIPYLKTSKELKTKPTQHTVKEMQRHGIQPDIIICRTEIHMTDDIKNKIASFCDVKKDAVIEGIDAKSIYDIPINFYNEKIDEVIAELLDLKKPRKNITKMIETANNYNHPSKETTVAIVGKYVQLSDSYISVIEALKHAGAALGARVNIKLIDSEEIEKNGPEKLLDDAKGILVPGGFGTRGIEGKIRACRYARKNNIPYFGLCLGMQIAVIEFARDVCGLKDASSTEFGKTKNNVIDIMEYQKGIYKKGGTMRLGAYPCVLNTNSKSYSLYKKKKISERHRHRYEFNNKYRELFEKNGMLIAGTNPDSNLVEIIEIPSHKWFIGTQFHPEFKSRINKPHPLFYGFVKSTL